MPAGASCSCHAAPCAWAEPRHALSAARPGAENAGPGTPLVGFLPTLACLDMPSCRGFESTMRHPRQAFVACLGAKVSAISCRLCVALTVYGWSVGSVEAGSDWGCCVHRYLLCFSLHAWASSSRRSALCWSFGSSSGTWLTLFQKK